MEEIEHEEVSDAFSEDGADQRDGFRKIRADQRDGSSKTRADHGDEFRLLFEEKDVQMSGGNGARRRARADETDSSH